MLPELAGKRLELLKETVPKLSRVAVLWDPQNAGSTQIWEESQRQAKELGLQLHSLELNSAAELDGGFKDAVKAGSGALAGTSGALLASASKTNRLTWRQKIGCRRYIIEQSYVANGGLMSYGPDDVEPYRRAALMVDKILKGAKPADLPVEQPTKFELVINLKTAKQIGLTIPPCVLMRADESDSIADGRATKQRSRYDNENQRIVLDLALCAMLFALCVPRRGAAAEESPSDRVSIGDRSSYVSPPVPRQFGWLCASLAT